METVAIVSTAISAGTAIIGGMQQSRALEMERRQHEENAELAKLAAAQEESARLKELDKMLATQRAMAIARGYDPDESGSFLALQEEDRRQALADIETAKITRLSQARASRYAAAQAGSNTGGAMLSSFGGAAGSLFRYVSTAGSIGGKKAG